MAKYFFQAAALGDDCKMPDSFEPKGSILPSDDFVISRNAKGQVVSRFGDPYWDFYPYLASMRGRTKIYFSAWAKNPSALTQQISLEIKQILFCVMWKSGSGRSGILSINTITGSHTKACTCLARGALRRKLTLLDLLGDPVHFAVFLKSLTSTELINVRAVVNLLSRMDPLETGISIIAGSELLKMNKLLIDRGRDRQFPVIPARILHNMLTSWHQQIEDVSKKLPNIVSFLEQVLKEEGYGLSHHMQQSKYLRKTYLPTFREAAISHELWDWFCLLGISNLNKFATEILYIQAVCKSLIQVYSGMRNDEALNLEVDCLSIETLADVGRVRRIIGKTTKLSGSAKKAQWITSKEVDLYIKVAKVIATTIIQEVPVSGANLLFISVGYLPFSSGSPNHNRIISSHLGYTPTADPLKRIKELVTITEKDVLELEKIDPFYAWRSDPDFSVGKIWRLTSHQFRRTLAVYAAQSGLVSIPSLRRQLQHITEEMTLYYTNGSARADAIFGVQTDHVSKVYQRSSSEAEAISYIYEVLCSEQNLLGAHGAWVTKRKPPEKIISLEKREEIVKRFRRGEIAYKETVLGACTSVEACNKRALRVISACVSCSKAVIKPDKLATVITAQQRLVNQLDKESLEERIERDQLADLQRFQNEMLRGSNVGGS